MKELDNCEARVFNLYIKHLDLAISLVICSGKFKLTYYAYLLLILIQFSILLYLEIFTPKITEPLKIDPNAKYFYNIGIFGVNKYVEVKIEGVVKEDDDYYYIIKYKSIDTENNNFHIRKVAEDELLKTIPDK